MIIILIIFLIFHIIEIEITLSTENNSFLYTLMVAITFGIYLNILGLFNKGFQEQNTKYIIFVLLIMIYLVINSYFSICLIFNFDFLHYTRLGFSSKDGIWFLWYNWYLFSILFFLSFTIESEIGIQIKFEG